MTRMMTGRSFAKLFRVYILLFCGALSSASAQTSAGELWLHVVDVSALRGSPRSPSERTLIFFRASEMKMATDPDLPTKKIQTDPRAGDGVTATVFRFP